MPEENVNTQILFLFFVKQCGIDKKNKKKN